MDWKSVNWAQVLVLVVLVAVLHALTALWIVSRVKAMHARARRDLAEQHKAFLRNEYARMAGESTIYQNELRELITEVHGMAIAFKDAISSDSWDPDEHLERLSLLDAGMARLRAVPNPSPPSPA